MDVLRQRLFALGVFAIISTALLYIYKVSDKISSVNRSQSPVLFPGEQTSKSERPGEVAVGQEQRRFVVDSGQRLVDVDSGQGLVEKTVGQKSGVEHKTANVSKKPSVRKRGVTAKKGPMVQPNHPVTSVQKQRPLKGKAPVQQRPVVQQKPRMGSKTDQTAKVKETRKKNPVDHILRKGSQGGSISKRKDRGAKSVPTDPMAKAFELTRTLVAFIGYPRSGHTLVSSLLDAHPHIAVANEYQVFQKWVDFDEKQRNRLFVFNELYNAAVSASQKGVRSLNAVHTFNYSVPGEWSGKHDRFLQVIGDKHGPKSTKLLSDETGRKIMTEIQDKLKVSIRLIHVVRNPYDNVATMAIRASNGRQFIEQGKILRNATRLEQQTRVYAGLLRDNSYLRTWFHVFDVHSSDLIAHPKETVEQICRYLHVECTDKYLSHCASVVFSSPSKTRKNVQWTPRVAAAINYLINKYPFLSRYNFDTD